MFGKSKNQNHYHGFTLIELLVVIGIIAAITSIILVGINNARVKARDTKRISDIKQLQNALALYYSYNNSYPNSLNLLAPKFLTFVPTPPLGTTQAAYSYARYGAFPNVTSYHLGAVLEESKTVSKMTQRNCRSGSNTGGAPAQCVSGVNATAGGFNGLRSTCTNGGAAPDLCFDVTP